MEFMNRGTRQPQPVGTPASNAGATTPTGGSRKKSKSWVGLNLAFVALLFSGTILVVALLWFLVIGGPANEAKSIDKSKLQAVFLNGGQVYFGNIRELNGKFMRVGNIYYLRVNQQVQPDQQANQNANDVSLVKLGCELHGPQDEMLINREQVVFWENLKSDGQVAKAVAEYQKQNPNGQNCNAQQSTSTDNSNSTTNNSSSTTNNSSSTTKKQ